MTNKREKKGALRWLVAALRDQAKVAERGDWPYEPYRDCRYLPVLAGGDYLISAAVLTICRQYGEHREDINNAFAAVGVRVTEGGLRTRQSFPELAAFVKAAKVPPPDAKTKRNIVHVLADAMIAARRRMPAPATKPTKMDHTSDKVLAIVEAVQEIEPGATLKGLIRAVTQTRLLKPRQALRHIQLLADAGKISKIWRARSVKTYQLNENRDIKVKR